MGEHAGGNSLNANATSASRIVQVAGSVYGGIAIGGDPGSTPDVPDGWGRLVATARVWEHVPGHRDTRRMRAQAVDAAVRLSRLRDEAAHVLGDDPWHEPDFGTRFVEHVDWLLGEPGPDAHLDLFPVEAALLVLVPLVYQVHYLQTAARLVEVSPWRPGADADPGPERAAFEEFADRYGSLRHRARLRPSAAPAIGWWIFHRWLVHQEFADERRVAPLCADFDVELAAVFTSERVSALLHGLRRGPSVCSPEYLSGLRADDQVRRAGNQHIREQRLALLLALAHGVSVEMHTMPDVVAEHLGIPDAVDLAELGATLHRASWTGSQQVPVLSARCHHAAVIEGLRTHVARTDELLHAVHRTVRERITHPMPTLPARLSSDDVLPVDAAVTGWAGFRVDGPRIRELLMGETLYKDRDLAVRELYQNALDACRHRRARTEYLSRTRVEELTFDGLIEIEQGVEPDGRRYVECRENGIGMGDAELRGVFSKAGARFAEQPDFKQEQAAWQRLDPPVAFHPNSRFGIGVLSYFMLADEVRVTSCRMGLDGTLGPVLTATMFGPEHLFRITELARRGDRPGTAVRLYLKDGVRADWSAPAVLERLLGIAEFTTVAWHGDRRQDWAPGQIKIRQGRTPESLGYSVQGTLVEWPGAPEGVSVAWCAQGGALLVDGLVVNPADRAGVVWDSRTQPRMTGVVVNLTGEHAPERLSVDRSTVLGDLSDKVEGLLREAAEAVLVHDRSLLCVEWLYHLSAKNPRLADVVTEVVVRHDLTLSCGRDVVPIGKTGFLSADISLVNLRPDWRRLGKDYQGPRADGSDRLVPDSVLLWRLLAHGSGRWFAELLRLCPELARFGAVRPAVPSRERMVKGVRKSEWWNSESAVSIAVLVGAAEVAELSTAGLLAELKDFGVDCVEFPEADDVPVSSAVLRALCDEHGYLVRSGMRGTVTGLVQAARQGRRSVEEVAALWRRCGVDVSEGVVVAATAAAENHHLKNGHIRGKTVVRYWEPDEVIPPGCVVRMSLDLARDVSEIRSMLGSWGYSVDVEGLQERPTRELATMLSVNQDGTAPWLSRAETVPPACVLEFAENSGLAPREVVERFTASGFAVSDIPADASSADLEVVKADGSQRLVPGGDVPYWHIFSFGRAKLGWAIHRLAAYGFDVPLSAPLEFDELDTALFDDGVIDWSPESIGTELPFAKVVLVASRVNTSPGRIAARLAARGVPVSATRLPRGLPFSLALQVLDHFVDEDSGYYDLSNRPGLRGLLEMSDSLRVPIPQLVTWLNGLGLHTPDIVTAIREAAKGVPRAS
ncbi:hypothetical protein B0I31_103342 [Saccharothrix carnea]|uniref:Histidine kinase/DNA gyrase B/HSP90-like ATPase n=1 Tax=Saccharothrix carnea TaxID=1280637 RepID=A0A2P8IDP2_SACCR|nr:ATP-binding protein [Saccharothrix carnea]PSL56589.1 hypothetical protein B0I31_103342 [Saccharothrix carnea]